MEQRWILPFKTVLLWAVPGVKVLVFPVLDVVGFVGELSPDDGSEHFPQKQHVQHSQY